MGYLPLRLAVSGILGADRVTAVPGTRKRGGGVGPAAQGALGRPHWGAAGPRAASPAGSLGRRGILAVDCRNATFSGAFFTRALPHGNFSLRACGGQCPPALAAPANQSNFSRGWYAEAARHCKTPGPEPANLF